MRTGGLLLIARHVIGWVIRGFGRVVARAGQRATIVCYAAADMVDPPAPGCVERPPEWDPRLWARTGGRSAAEARD